MAFTEFIPYKQINKLKIKKIKNKINKLIKLTNLDKFIIYKNWPQKFQYYQPKF